MAGAQSFKAHRRRVYHHWRSPKHACNLSSKSCTGTKVQSTSDVRRNASWNVDSFDPAWCCRDVFSKALCGGECCLADVATQEVAMDGNINKGDWWCGGGVPNCNTGHAAYKLKQRISFIG